MAWSFRKRVKIFPGVYINLAKNGISTFVGSRGAYVNFNKKGTYLQTAIPGTGGANRQRIFFDDSQPHELHNPSATPYDLTSANGHLYDVVKGNWRGNKEIRSSSLQIFQNLFPIGNSFISETAKIEFIKKKKFRKHFVLTLLFKYFSQYQHFSQKMHAFLLTSAEKDLDFYHKMLIEVLCVVSECNVILNTIDNEANKRMIFKGIADLNTLYNDFIGGVNLND